MSPILKLDHEDEDKELEFDLDFQSRLTVQERFDVMQSTSRRIMEILIRNGHRKPVEIAKRP